MTHFFKHIPAILCTECVTQMEAHINFKICVENCISELEKTLPAPEVKGRGRPKKLDSEKKIVQNGHVKSGKGRGRPRKDATSASESIPRVIFYDYDAENDASTKDDDKEQAEVKGERRGRKRKNLVYNMDTSDSEEWDPKKEKKYTVKVKFGKPSSGTGKRGRPKKIERRGRPRKNVDGSDDVKRVPVPSTSSEGGVKKRGRPKKITNGTVDPLAMPAKKRGRPKKVVAAPAESSENEFEQNEEEDEQYDEHENQDNDTDDLQDD